MKFPVSPAWIGRVGFAAGAPIRFLRARLRENSTRGAIVAAAAAAAALTPPWSWVVFGLSAVFALYPEQSSEQPK